MLYVIQKNVNNKAPILIMAVGARDVFPLLMQTQGEHTNSTQEHLK